MKKWIIGSPDPGAVAELGRQSDLSELCCQVLASQGCISISQASQRMGCSALSDPFLICDMQEAADAINAAVDAGKRICIYGDYDCDGVMATVILYSFLHEIGADVTWRIPEREEGYGLNETAVREMREDGVQLIVTVDNGISAVREAALIRELGMELVITDHHQPGEVLPEAVAVVDPHREDNFSPFRLYCGAGLAMLLIAALNDGDTDMAMEQAGDLAAIASVADVVPLTGENRFIVQRGLEYLENTERAGLRCLRNVAGLTEKPMTSSNVAFFIGPRINAAGRMVSPKLAVELLLEEDSARAKELAEEIDRLNTQRREIENNIMRAAVSQLEEERSRICDRVMIFAGEAWHHGVIGIAAARLVERFGKPTFVISIRDGVGTGSARSFGAFSVFGCLRACEDLLEKYGGHPSAGGFTIRSENIPAFRARVQAYAAEHHPQMPALEINVACALKPEHINVETIRSLSQLEPFGCGNPEPVFVLQNAVVRDIVPLSAGTHTKFLISVDGQPFEALLFRVAPACCGVTKGQTCHMLVKPSVSSYMGRERVSLIVQDLRISGLKQGQVLNAIRTYEAHRRGEPLEPAYYRAACPSREDCVKVYKAVSEAGIRIEELMVRMYGQQINYCKMRICLDVFEELGLLSIRECESFACRLPGGRRVNLQDSRILRELEQRMKEVTV